MSVSSMRRPILLKMAIEAIRLASKSAPMSSFMVVALVIELLGVKFSARWPGGIAGLKPMGARGRVAAC